MTGAAENGAMLLDSKKKLISKTYLHNAWPSVSGIAMNIK